MNILKPCPFCGRTDKLSVQIIPPLRHTKQIYCDACGATGPGGCETGHAIEYWNNREDDT